MPTTITLSGAIDRVCVAPRVYTSPTWADDWTLEPNLECTGVRFTAAPEIAQATFVWRFGRLLRPDAGAWEVVDPLDDLLRSWVKVVIEDPAGEYADRTWYGLVEEQSAAGRTVFEVTPDGEVLSGVQHFTAYGLDIMLQRHTISESLVHDAEAAEIFVGRGLEFNALDQVTSEVNQASPNRSPDVNELNSYVFAHDLKQAAFWTTLDIIQYLLINFAPTDQTDELIIPWAVWPGMVPEWDQPRKATHGRTVKRLLDELLDSTRLLGYVVELDSVEDPEDTIFVRPFSFAADEITFEDHTLPANTDQKVLIFERDSGVTSAVLKTSTSRQVDQVVCTGARAVACFTITTIVGDLETMVPHWDDEEQGIYDSGAAEAAGYDAADRATQQLMNKLVREGPTCKRAYAYFGLPTDWDGRVSTLGEEEPQVHFPDLANDDEDNPLLNYYPKLRFLHHLPLKTNHHYEGSNIEEQNILDDTPDGQKWEYRKPFVIMQLQNAQDGKSPWFDVSTLAETIEQRGPDDELLMNDALTWSANLRMQDDAPGLILNVSGAPQHFLAGDEFTPLVADTPDNEVDSNGPHFNYAEGMAATMAMEVDYYCQGRYPADDDVAATDAVRRTIIDMGAEDYQLHYVARSTVLNTQEDLAEIADYGVSISDGGFIRDDRDKLEALARLVFEWYGVPRKALALSTGYITTALRVGDLITGIGKTAAGGGEVTTLEEINAVVTAVEYQFAAGEGGASPRTGTRITTDFADIDPVRFVGLRKK